jgi:diguanylate cyclase (GGDEF)-like protein
MTLHSPTLGAAFVLLCATLGALLLFSWVLNRTMTALAWWGAAFWLVLTGMALVILGQGSPSPLMLYAANAFVTLAYGTLYGGSRVFNGRPEAIPAGLLGLGLWTLAFPFIHEAANLRLMTMSAIAGAYAAASAWELWRHALQRLASQRVAVILLAGLALFNALRSPLGFSQSSISWIDVFALRWSAEMALVLVVFVPTLAFIFLSMAKERLEFDYRQAALTDPLTGIPNRRAFLQDAARLIERAGHRPTSCLLFDLDNFKKLNDSHGHEVGDHILRVFGRTLSDHLPGGVFGRLGGEEFGAITALGKSDAGALAETIRRSFAVSGATVGDLRVGVTVSVGCATAIGSPVTELLHRADIALYEAKAGGRNLVASARPGMPAERRILRSRLH